MSKIIATCIATAIIAAGCAGPAMHAQLQPASVSKPKPRSHSHAGIRKQIRRLRSELRALRRQVGRASADGDVAAQRVAQGEIEALQVTVAELKERLQAIEPNANTERLGAIERRLSQLEDQEAAPAAAQAPARQPAATATLPPEVRAELDDLKKKYTAMQAAARQQTPVTSVPPELAAELSELQKKLAALEAARKSADQQNAKLKSDLANDKELLIDQLFAINEALEKLEAFQTKTEADAKNRGAGSQQLQTRLTDLVTRLNQRVAKLEQDQQALARTAQTTGAGKTEIADLKSQIDELASAVTELRRRLRTLSQPPAPSPSPQGRQ